MRNPHSWFFHLCALEGVLALFFLLRIPSEGGSLSLARLALIVIFLALIGLGGFFGLRNSRALDIAVNSKIIWAAALLSLGFGLLLFLLRYINPDRLLPIYERLSPLIWYLFILSVQFTFYLLFLKNGLNLESLKQIKPIYTASFPIFFLLILILLFVTFTRLGITKDEAYWGEPGVAILGWQFILAILLGLTTLVYSLSDFKNPDSPIHRFILPLSIYLAASVLWLNVPLESLRNSFYAPITPPYTTPFPYSDAGYYDYLSQTLLIGADYLGGIPPRPLYVTFLAALHSLFGQNYVSIIAAQTLVFALFPVALYLLGSRLHSRAAGVTVAFFAIFRELVTLWISSNTRTASTKMFITDFATATAIAFVCLAALRWLERRDDKSALIAGGSFGLLLLLRTQSLIVLPVLFLAAFFAYQKNVRQWIRAGVAFGLTMVLTITPWLMHNYTVTGKFTFDDPGQMAVIYSQYSFSENLDISQFDFGSESVGSRIITFTLENPGFVSSFIANHFLNTEIGGLLALPLIKPFAGLYEPIHLYWITWDGTLEWYNSVLVLIHLAVIAIGLGAAWARYRWIGFVPLAFNIGYALANGISRFSAWRYNLPVDWIVYFYYGIGIIEILLWVASIFGAHISRALHQPSVTSPTESFKLSQAWIVVMFVFIGSLPWLAKGLAQPRYEATTEELGRQVITQGVAADELDEFLSAPGTVILEGRSLYPRFFRREDGIFSANPWSVYKVRDFARMGFVVLNQSFNGIILPSNKALFMPQGEDVILLGCQRDDYIEARWIFMPESGEIFQAEAPVLTCSP